MAADEDNPSATKPGEERRGGRDRRQRPSVTIDLTAEKTDGKPAAPTPARAETTGAAAREATGGGTRPTEPAKEQGARTRPAAPTQRSDGWARIGLAGAIGGAIALLVVLILQATGLMPVPGGPAADRAIETASLASGQVAALERRVMALEAMTTDLPTVRAGIRGIGDEVTALQESVKGLAPTSAVAALTGEVAGVRQAIDAAPAAATKDELAALTDRVGRLEARPATGDGTAGGAVPAALTARIDDIAARLGRLAGRIDQLEQKLAATPTTSPSETAARTVALTSLRRAAAGSEPFAADVDVVAAFGAGGDDLRQLRTHAVKGVPTAADLAAAFPPVADAILSATASENPNVGWWGKLAGSVRGLVSIKPAGPMPGDDPPAIVSRMQAAVDNGDLADALAERGALPPAGQQASADWAQKAADRLSVDRLVAGIVEAASGGG